MSWVVWILVFLAVFLVIGCFIAGWKLGSTSREKSIRLKGLENINAHYQKMADNFNKVDHLVDNALSLLDDGVCSKKDKPSDVSTTS